MNSVKRVIFDTSTLVSAALRPNSVPRQAFLKAIAQTELCVSDATLAELREVMSRDKFDRYLSARCACNSLSCISDTPGCSKCPRPTSRGCKSSCRDPRDNKSLALALACSADFVVSSDEDFC